MKPIEKQITDLRRAHNILTAFEGKMKGKKETESHIAIIRETSEGLLDAIELLKRLQAILSELITS